MKSILSIMFVVALHSVAISANLSEHARKIIMQDRPHYADSPKVVWQDTNNSSCSIVDVGDEDIVTVIRNHSYVSAYPYFAATDSWRHLVISQTTEWVLNGDEGNNPWLEATGLLVESDGSAKPLWSISEEADLGRPERDFYRTVSYSASGLALDVIKLRRLTDGKLILTCTDSVAAFESLQEGKPAGRRYVASLGAGYSDGTFRGTDSLVLARLYFASADSCLHTLSVQANSMASKHLQRRCGLGHCLLKILNVDSAFGDAGRDPNRWSVTADRRSLSASVTHALEVTFDCPEPAFIIPIRDDDFVLDRANFSGYNIIRLR